MKKFISFVMALGMAFMLWGVPIEVSAEDSSGSCGDNVTWTYDDAGKTLTISGAGAMNDYEGLFDRPWESLRSSIENVVIDKGVTSIGNNAFESFSSLKSISIPNSVASIGERAFYKCKALEGISIPSSVTSIGDSAFYWCENLESIDIPNSVTSIGHGAFSSCSALTRAVIPDSVTSMGNAMFSSCSALTDVTIPNSITKIDSITFYRCTSLENITIPDSVTMIDESAFKYCTSLENITIPNSVTMIGNGAFESCTSLTSITIPDSVTSVGERTFEQCTNLTAVYAPSGLNIDSAAIPETSLKIKYTVTYGKATITEIIPAAGSTTVAIPEAINGYEVTAVAGEAQEKVDKTAHTVHRGGSATCIAQAVCGICGESYGSLGEHNYSEDWSHDENEHWHECTVCGGKTDTNAHSFENWEHNDSEHWQVCTVCSYETDKEAHIWDEGEITTQPTASAEGVKTYTCTVCGAVKTEAVPATGEPLQPQPPSRPQPPTHTPSTPAAENEENLPHINGNNGKNGWQAISEEIAETRTGGIVTVDMNGTTELPKNIAADIAGKDVDLVLNMGGGISWTINGLSVTDPKTVDMSVSANTQNIPVDVINYVSGENYTMQLSLAHSGDFGFTATLTVNLSKKNNGLYANLFHYDETLGELDFSCCDKIENGSADLVFTHASEWAIVISEKPMYEDVSAAAGIVDDGGTIGTVSSNYVSYCRIISYCGIIIVIIGTGIVEVRKRRQK